MKDSNDMEFMSFDNYLQSFDYEERKEMKISISEMLSLLEKDKVQVIDIRFPQEYEAWHFGASKNIPLNELPTRINEIDKNKLVVTACPHNDRANIARMYLHLKGYNAKYLNDGLLKVLDYLRGDKAKNFVEEYNKIK